MAETSNARCISLFSGAGGMDWGVRNAGYDIVFATDIDPLCEQAHQLNFSDTDFHCGSIETVDRERLEQHLTEPVDLLVGGPPCPPYSKSRFWLQDKPRGLNDPVADTTLTGYLRVLKIVKPEAFIFENVPGFRYKPHQAALDYLETQSKRLGYRTEWRILNAADFGVPQTRQRFIMIGNRNGAPRFPAATHSNSHDRNGKNLKLKPWVTAGDALAKLDSDEFGEDLEGHKAGGKYRDLLREIPQGENYLYFSDRRNPKRPEFEWRSRYWSFLLKLSQDRPAWTIQGTRSNNQGPLHWRNRILRIEELKRLQTFPNNFHLVGGVLDQWRQVGNAVPPRLAWRLAAVARRSGTNFREIAA